MQLAIKIKKKSKIKRKDNVGSASKLHMVKESRYIAFLF